MSGDSTTPGTAVTPTTPGAAASADRKGAAVKLKAIGAPAGADMRLGMSFWGTGTLVAGIASDLAKPVADVAPLLFIAFLLAAAGAAYLAFVRKPALPFARTAVGACGLGAAVFGFFIIARTFATPGDLGEERGFIASVAPPAAALQTAVLPLTPVEKELLNFSSRISTGDPQARSAAAREGLATTADPPLRRAMLERVLHDSDANVRQAGVVRALADRGRASVPILPQGRADDPLVVHLTGSYFGFRSFNAQTGTGAGGLVAGGANRPMTAVVANGRMILTSQYARDGAWKDGLVLDLSVDDRLQFVGTARTPEDEPIGVEVPLL